MRGAWAVILKKKSAVFSAVFAACLLFCPSAFAGQGAGSQILGGLQSTLDDIVQGLTGPIGIAIGTIALVVFGLMWALGEESSPMRRGGQILLGLTLVFGAATVVSNIALGAVI